MHRIVVAAAFALVASSALAQTPPAQIGDRYVPAPWWMREPVIASIGAVRTEAPANRAQFQASFQVVERTADDATRKAADKVREISRALGAYGAERVQVETTFSMRPLYDQYRNKEGTVVENQRSDKIDAYEVNANMTVRVRDVAVLEKVYASVLGARPSATQPVYFQLEPSNELKTWLQTEAVKDSARRARQAAEAAGARLGPVRVIDPTSRACETDVLAGWPSYGGSEARPTDVDAPVAASRMAMAPPPPPPAPAAPGMDVQVTLQPPMRELTDQACVVYGLAG
jgi:uncharacterized protein YggE